MCLDMRRHIGIIGKVPDIEQTNFILVSDAVSRVSTLLVVAEVVHSSEAPESREVLCGRTTTAAM